MNIGYGKSPLLDEPVAQRWHRGENNLLGYLWCYPIRPSCRLVGLSLSGTGSINLLPRLRGPERQHFGGRQSTAVMHPFPAP